MWTIPNPNAPVAPERYLHPSRIDPPDGAASDIRSLAATGFSKRGIANHFSVDLSTLNRWLDEDEALQAAFDVGRDQERFALHNALYQKAMNGDGPAAMFLLKARHGYREGDQADQANKVQITFNLPGATKAEDYGNGKVIDAADSPAKRVPRTTLERA